MITRLRDKYRCINISTSFEHIDQVGINLKAIYATRRFEVALNLATETSVRMLVTDIDISFTSSVHSFMEAIGDADVGLMFEGRVLPWFANPATIAYFSSTEPSRKFLSQLNAYVDHAFRSSPADNIWFVDQNALYVARHMLESGTMIVNLSAIQPGLFGCYTTEGRDAYTERRSRELGLSD
jgi:hypothetical protein